ncbi:MAG: iron-sulfur cluster repair di-iron protein [Candidatus Pseudobacter hemicellulosilyticus]|uniref:Iron-sulfur cluster repair di-iron protein n=1 Tax=Candidatus Pseudobacter hemicellulosilyticus TaxID=3121375 RepID=A0AAJ6BED9_9BACT|nr:MAG: iron-sulfur cluster repair di-iron protein [Pseudobacter sp.]
METVIAPDILNVTLLEPKLKHPTIFARFDQLPDSATLIIHNDHDPKPLYYQLLGERGNIFAWEYLEQGPEWWKVAITKNLHAASTETLGQLAAKDLRKAQVFKKYGLDFCCGGKKTVREACAEKGLDATRIEQELKNTSVTLPGTELRYMDWSLDFLADFIINTHHAYVRTNLPDVRFYARKVAAVHGGRHPELGTIRQLVEEIAEELTAHLEKEEQQLFPRVKQLAAAVKANKCIMDAGLQAAINDMETEHETVGGKLEVIRKLTDDYQLPPDACASYNLLYRLLAEFTDDLHIHIHLENNILFPKALDLEKELLEKKQQAAVSDDWDQVQARFADSLVTIDVRPLEMPKPMLAILEALEKLPAEKALFVYHKKVPVFLLPELKDRQYSYRIKELGEGQVHMLIFKESV